MGRLALICHTALGLDPSAGSLFAPARSAQRRPCSAQDSWVQALWAVDASKHSGMLHIMIAECLVTGAAVEAGVVA